MESVNGNQTNPRPAPEEIKDLLEDELDAADLFGPLTAPVEDRPPRGLEFLYDVPLQVSVEVGRCRILLRDLLKMGAGQVIELDKMVDDPLELYVNSRLIARGKPVKVGEKFGIKLTEVISASDRIEKLGR
ncbi:MAG: flagellar motor switch protein FliN [Desulfofustis sp.]|jgi:flagellar motor switch protein FliN/FliY|nr:flagellar motor switch protein FliN [Desulfofustis sp.]